MLQVLTLCQLPAFAGLEDDFAKLDFKPVYDVPEAHNAVPLARVACLRAPWIAASLLRGFRVRFGAGLRPLERWKQRYVA